MPRSHLELALDRCQLFNLKSATAETLEAFGNLYRERGEFARAMDFYDEAARAYRDAGLSLKDRELLDERATLYLRMNELVLAEREANEYYQARKESSPGERSTALITRGRIEMAAGRTIEAEASLIEAATLARAGGLYYNEARAATSLARLLWTAGRSAEALDHLRRGINLAIRYDYSYWLASEAASAQGLFRAAIDRGLAADYLSQVAPMESLGVETAQNLGARQIKSQPPVELIIERPNYDLAINMLGPAEIYRDPSDTLKDAWRLTKALHILCYIASRRNRRAPKDTLVDLFWEDAEPETVAKNFHPTISHLRKALNTGHVVKKDFVLYREGAYLLNPQYQYQIDTEEFERLLADAREARRSNDARRGRAVVDGSHSALSRGFPGRVLLQLDRRASKLLQGFIPRSPKRADRVSQRARGPRAGDTLRPDNPSTRRLPGRCSLPGDGSARQVGQPRRGHRAVRRTEAHAAARAGRGASARDDRKV